MFISYGYSQSLIDCDYSAYPQCRANKPVCHHPPKKINCLHNGKEIEGYVPNTTSVKYIKVNITSPSGQIQEKRLQVTAQLNNFDDNFNLYDFAYGFLYRKGDIQSGDTLELADNPFVINTESTKFSEKREALFRDSFGNNPALSPTAKSLAQYLSSNPLDSTSNVRCNYSTAPSIITVLCDENCQNRNCGTKEVCVGSAQCLINRREFKIHNVHCSAAPNRNPDKNLKCPPEAIDCISDNSIKAAKLNSKRFNALDYYGDETTYRESDDKTGGGALQ